MAAAADDTTKAVIMSPKPSHPLHEIASTPSHKLLLKQWLKEEELILSRLSLKESQLDSARRDITTLFLFFFLFHSTSLILLFASNSSNPQKNLCRRAWIPSLCSLAFSLGVIWAIRYKTDTEGLLEKVMAREKEDRELLGKCIEELRKKGLDFDLLKEVDALRRAKSMRVEAKIGKDVKRWSARDFVTLFFFAVSCFVVAIIRVILCN